MATCRKIYRYRNASLSQDALFALKYNSCTFMIMLLFYFYVKVTHKFAKESENIEIVVTLCLRFFVLLLCNLYYFNSFRTWLNEIDSKRSWRSWKILLFLKWSSIRHSRAWFNLTKEKSGNMSRMIISYHHQNGFLNWY